jgi:hypothetical protein
MLNQFKGSKAVEKWMSSINSLYHLSEKEWESRLVVLEEFCKTIGKHPDTIIAEALADRQEKIAFMRMLRKLSGERHGETRAGHDYQNITRSFFNHNGARVVSRPYQD